MSFWANDTPHAFVEEPLSHEKITIWCAIGYACLIGPYFEDTDGTPRDRGQGAIFGHTETVLMAEDSSKILDRRE